MAKAQTTTEPKPAKKKRGRPRKNRPAKSRPLPPPVEPAAAAAPVDPPASGNLLSKVAGMFQQKAEPGPAAVSSPASVHSSTSEPAARLAEDAERILRTVPASIGDSGEPAAQPAAGGEFSQETMAELMQGVAFEPQDVQDTLSEFFDMVADWFKSDHWKLSERQARMIGVPLSQVMNAVWQELCRAIPGPIARWIENTPGAMKLLMACGIVFVPKVKTQLKINRERRQVRKVEQLRGSQPARPYVAPGVPKVAPIEPIAPAGPVDMFGAPLAAERSN